MLKIAAGLAALGALGPGVFAQPVLPIPPEAAAQLQHTIGSRIEAVTVLGGDYGAAGGI